MNVEEFRKVIQRRIYVEEISRGEWAEGIEECWKKEIELLTEDISSTIEFLKEECSGEEFIWISEVLDDIVERVPSKEFVQCYKELMEKFPKECSICNIAGSVENAEEILRWEDEHDEKS